MENTEKQLNNLHEEEPLISLADIWGLIWGHKWWYVASLAFFLCVGVFYL